MEAGASVTVAFLNNQGCLKDSGLIKRIIREEEKGKEEEEGYVKEKEEFSGEKSGGFGSGSGAWSSH